MFEALLLRRVLKSGFLYQLCSKAYLEVLENYNQVSDAHTASPRMFAYQKTRKHPSKSDSRNSILLSKVVVSLAVLRGIEKETSQLYLIWCLTAVPVLFLLCSDLTCQVFQIFPALHLLHKKRFLSILLLRQGI